MSVRSDLRAERLEIARHACEWPRCPSEQVREDLADYRLEMAHLKQLSQGGPDVIGNVVMLCKFHHDVLDNRAVVHGRRNAIAALLKAYVSGTPRPSAAEWVT